MFDVGFMELALVAVVALVVIGPERLPGVARTAGKWIGSARRFVSSVQADINLEVNKADELKRLLEEQSNIQSLHEIIEQEPASLDERKPVPRAVPATAKKTPGSETETAAEEKPDYMLKAINDAPAQDAEKSSVPTNNKHD